MATTLSDTEHIDTSSRDFTSIEDYGGVYLLSPSYMFDNGILKIGFTNRIGDRIQQFRNAYGWIFQLYIFGLIVVPEREKMREIERELLEEFKSIRIRYLPYKGKASAIDSEWLTCDPKLIQTAFSRYKKKGFRVLPKSGKIPALLKAPMANLHCQVLRKVDSRNYEVSFPDGTRNKVEASVLNNTATMPQVKVSNPTEFKAKLITQEDANKILTDILQKHTRVEINRMGGLVNLYDERLNALISKRKRERSLAENKK
jgi:hypothetical protein